MTRPFQKPELRPPAPCWIVRQPLREDAVEIIYVGLSNRAELDGVIERLARWPWHLDEDGSVCVLADSRAEAIGVRIEHSKQHAGEILKQLIDLVGVELVFYACRADVWRRMDAE